MIYDVRQTTTYAYASPVAYARHVLAPDADRPRPASACMPPRSTSCPNAGASGAKGRISSATA